jgi:hypothetical protein
MPGGVSRPAASAAVRIDLLGCLRQRFAPDRECVRVLAADAEGGLRRAAEVERDVGLLRRAQVAPEVLDVVVGALVVERLAARPGELEDVEVLVGAGVALVLGEVVAVARHLGVGAARDGVQGDATARELVERREHARRDGRRHEPGAVRDEEAQPLGVLNGVGRDLRAFREHRRRADQHLVEARILVGARDAPGVLAVDDRAGGPLDLRLLARVDQSDEFNAHECSWVRRGQARTRALGRAGRLRRGRAE